MDTSLTSPTPARTRRLQRVAAFALACALTATVPVPAAFAAPGRADDREERGPVRCSELVAYMEGPVLDQSRVLAVPVRGGTPRVLHDGPQAEVDPDFSPDGRLLAFAARSAVGGLPVDNALQVLDLATREVRTLVRQARSGLRFPAWSPDGRQIAYSSGVGGNGGLSALHVIGADAEDGAGDRVVTTVPAGTVIVDIAWHPRGRELWFTSREPATSRYQVWSVRTDGTEVRLRDDTGDRGYVRFLRDGRRLVLEGGEVAPDGSYHSSLYRSTTSLDDVERIFPEAADQWNPALSPDGRWVAFLDFTTQELRVVPRTGGEERTLVPAVSDLVREGLTWQPRARCAGG